jgi:SAM-dependent methyltransferase
MHVSDMWDQRYTDHPDAFGTAPNDFLVAQLHRIPHGIGPVVCIGDGQGRNGVYIAEQGYEVVSVDLSPVGVAAAERLAKERGVPLVGVATDLAHYHPPVGIAGVVSIFCHLPPSVRWEVYPRLVDAMSPGAHWILESYTPDQIGRGTGGPTDPRLLLTADAIRVEVSRLAVVELNEIERDVVEGIAHTGRASVVQFVGRKY